MKKEVAFFKDRRGKFSANNLIAVYRMFGYSDEQIIEEMRRIQDERENTVWYVNAKTGAVHEEARSSGRPWGDDIIGPFEYAKEAQQWFAEFTARMAEIDKMKSDLDNAIKIIERYEEEKP